MTGTTGLESQQRAARQWGFLEDHADACGVVTPRMELLYLNAAARKLVPPCWFGCRCWEAFPVGSSGCAARCPVVRAVRSSSDACFCEETLHPPGAESPLELGLVAIPSVSGAALLVMRAKQADQPVEALRQPLLDEAERLRAVCAEQISRNETPKLMA